MRITIITIAALLLFALPAQAEDTPCRWNVWADYLIEYIPQLSALLGMLDIDDDDAVQFALANMDTFIIGLRDAAATKDDAELRHYLKMVGLELLAADADWDKIWTLCDDALPLTTTAAYRIEDGVARGWTVQAAAWLFAEGYIDSYEPSAVLLGMIDAWPQMSAAEKMTFRGMVASEYANAANMELDNIVAIPVV